MNEQQQHHGTSDQQLTGGAGPAGNPARLEQARSELAQVYAAADAIFESLRLDDPGRILRQARQSGGQ
jgi:hypothetical protein